MHSVSVMEVLRQQYTSCMKVGTGRNLDLSRETIWASVSFMVELSFNPNPGPDS